MPTELQEKLAAHYNKIRAACDKKQDEIESLKKGAHFALELLDSTKNAKRILQHAIADAELIEDPELQELVKQRMLEIWGE